VVGLFTLADLRAAQIRRALAANKHIIAEKPIADTVAQEEKLLEEIEASDRIVAVNLFNRNGWYHHEAQAFIDRGEIGKLAVIRICHMTPGTLPGESYKAEGPPFHNCGMHYIDVARWYAKSEYNTWHAQGVRMWGIDDPWWVTAHGTFENGVVFEVTNGFVYGHLAKDYIVSCWLECIGTLGVARYRHNFVDVELQLNGVNETIEKTGRCRTQQRQETRP
jgi:myo-inositol 2-dehydrogenase/D-chiro-inositol 1-dehydrogenase